MLLLLPLLLPATAGLLFKALPLALLVVLAAPNSCRGAAGEGVRGDRQPAAALQRSNILLMIGANASSADSSRTTTLRLRLLLLLPLTVLSGPAALLLCCTATPQLLLRCC